MGGQVHGERCPIVWAIIGMMEKNENKSRCGLRRLWRDDLGHNNQPKKDGHGGADIGEDATRNGMQGVLLHHFGSKRVWRDVK